MTRLLIHGVDSVVGANLAAACRAEFDVIGICTRTRVSIAGCRALGPDAREARIPVPFLNEWEPDLFVDCSVAGRSAWETPLRGDRASDAARALSWLTAARDAECACAVISTDAVFTGPRIFHREFHDDYCRSPEAAAVLEFERRVTALDANALIVRTHAFGWSPVPTDPCWVEAAVRALGRPSRPQPSYHADDAAAKPVSIPGAVSPGDVDCHATPILASDLAAVLSACWEAGISGLIHVGGERTNPWRLASTAARLAGIPQPDPAPSAREPLGRLADAETGRIPDRTLFGRSETALASDRARREVQLPVRSLEEALGLFLEQAEDGFRDSLRGEARLLHVA